MNNHPIISTELKKSHSKQNIFFNKIMSKIAIIFLHLGNDDDKSKEILDMIEQSGVKGISKILATSDSTQSWLRNNAKGIVITKYPSFIVAQGGHSTQIYDGDDVNIIIDMVRKLNQT